MKRLVTRNDAWPALFLILLSIAFWFQLGSDWPWESVYFPRVVLTLLVVFSVVMLVLSLRAAPPPAGPKKAINWPFVLAGVVAMGAYVFLMEFIGYIPSTVLGLVPLMWLMNYRKPLHMVVTAFVAAGVIYVGFGMIMGVPLPTGSLFEQ